MWIIENLSVQYFSFPIRSAGIKSPANACTIVRAGFIEMAAAYRGAPFDLVLLDPPYDDPALAGALLAADGIVSDDGLVVLEHATRVAPPEGAFRTVKAGDSFSWREPDVSRCHASAPKVGTVMR